MKKLLISGFVLSGAVFLNACSSGSTANVNVSTNGNTAQNLSPNASGGDPTANVVVSQANNPIAGDVAITPSGGANTMQMPTPIPGGKEIAPGIVVPPGTKVEIKNNPNATLNAQAKPLQVAAPENSQVQTQMSGEGKVTRTRLFKNHPTLLRVEEIITPPSQTPTITVTTRDGKSAQVSDVKGLDIASASSQELLRRIGVNVETKAPTKEDTKKADKETTETAKP